MRFGTKSCDLNQNQLPSDWIKNDIHQALLLRHRSRARRGGKGAGLRPRTNGLAGMSSNIQRIGHYRLGKNLGIGSFGKVRRASSLPSQRRARTEGSRGSAGFVWARGARCVRGSVAVWKDRGTTTGVPSSQPCPTTQHSH